MVFPLVPYPISTLCASMDYSLAIIEFTANIYIYAKTIFVFLSLGYFTQDDSFLVPSIAANFMMSFFKKRPSNASLCKYTTVFLPGCGVQPLTLTGFCEYLDLKSPRQKKNVQPGEQWKRFEERLFFLWSSVVFSQHS